MKYKVGDRVKMRSLQWCKENIFNNEDKYPPELFRGIEKFCGKILTVSDAVDKSKYVDEGYYNMDEDTEWDYYWTDEMIEGLAEEENNHLTENVVDAVRESNDRYRIVLDPRFDIEVDEGEYYAVRRKKGYTKTYEECCEMLSRRTLTQI